MSGVATAVVAGAVVGGIASNMAADTQASAATDAANTQANANRYASDLQYQAWKEQQALQKPWLNAGQNALSRLSTGLQPGGEFGTKFSQTDWQQDPGYAFRLAEGNKLLNQTAAARGGLISGNALKAAQRYGQDMGSQEYQNAFNRYYREREAMMNPLQSLSGVGQTTAQSLGGAAQNYGNAAGALASATGASSANALMAGANARASSYSGIGSSIGQGLTGIGNYLRNYNTSGGLSGGGSDTSLPYYYGTTSQDMLSQGATMNPDGTLNY